MRFREIGSLVRRNLNNVIGWSTNRKIVVIESDDWGSIRLPSKSVLKKFERLGMVSVNTPYNQFDSLECNDDLTALFEVLSKHKGNNHFPVCFTANMIMANPDFSKIRSSGFRRYDYELLQETLKSYPLHDNVCSLYFEGLKVGVFKPQFHGREHVQVNRWLKSLRKANDNMLFAFDCGTTYSGRGDYNFMESFDWDSEDELPNQVEILRDGLRLFKELFGYSSDSFIAPCYTWDARLEPILEQEGVRYMQGTMSQYMPLGGFNNYRKKRHTMGESNGGLTYLTRNCFFEPSLVPKSDWVDYTLASISDAFRWNKPAIICSHRINFIGYIDEANRTRNLKLLDELLRRMLLRWPDIEFMSSDQLGDLITSTHARQKPSVR